MPYRRKRGDKMKLSKAQSETLAKIKNRPICTPDTFTGDSCFSPPYDWNHKIHGGSVVSDYTWFKNRVYGRLNTSTLKSLEKKGLIKVHFFGGAYGTDVIEILEENK